jgi:TRAP-type mannitol/chloroaromatic compound transport system permease large subunit
MTHKTLKLTTIFSAMLVHAELFCIIIVPLDGNLLVSPSVYKTNGSKEEELTMLKSTATRVQLVSASLLRMHCQKT